MPASKDQSWSHFDSRSFDFGTRAPIVFKKKSCLMFIYNFSVMTDPPNLLLYLYKVISLHHHSRPRLHLSANCLLYFLALITFYFSFFALSHWSYFIVLYLLYKHFYFPDSKLYIKVINLSVNLFHLDPFSFSTLLFFLPYLFYSLS